VEITLADEARRLRELIVALDRRAPRAEDAAESAIARDAAVLREKALNRLAEIEDQGNPAPDERISTAFPATPGDVAALTVQEFTFDFDDLDGNRPPSLELVCRAFTDDANRAVVWWIRFAAFRNWCARTDNPARSKSRSWTLRDACEVAAGFPLNHLWEFDARDFGFAVEAAAARRAQATADQ
jgi:hypothetical protein